MNALILHKSRFIYTMNKKLRYAILLVLAIACVAFYFARDRKRYVTAQGVVWTTEYHITYESNANLADSINAVFNKIDASANVYNKSSLVSQFNDYGEVNADSILTLLLAEARTVYEQSDSLYDPTVMPLVTAWKKARKEKRTPSKGYIDGLLALVGLDNVKVENGVMRAATKGVQLDFSSIAKGLACDEVGRMLERNGVTNYLVEIGGEVVAHGVNERGACWYVSVDMPTDQAEKTEHASALVLALDGKSVATSGNYRQFAMVDGKRVTHIIDPKTGAASQSDLLSVSIVAPRCVTADAWATACMAMGTASTQALMDKRNDLGVMTISTDSVGNYIVWSNAAFAACVEK